MSNMLAIAHKELRAYFASPIAYIVIGFFALLFGWFYIGILDWFVRQGMQGQMGMGGPQRMNVNQQMIRPLHPERHGRVPLPAAADHDAHLRGGEAVGHDRAAAHVAADGPADRPREVPRSAGAVRRDGGADAASTSGCSSRSASPNGSRWPPPISGCCSSAGASLRVGLFISSLTKNQIVAGAATFGVFLLALGGRLDR